MAPFDFDRMARLAREDPAAFEAQRIALLEEALARIPSAHQDGARAALALLQVRLAAARTPAERMALSFAAMGEALRELQARWTSLLSEHLLSEHLLSEHLLSEHLQAVPTPALRPARSPAPPPRSAPPPPPGSS